MTALRLVDLLAEKMEQKKDPWLVFESVRCGITLGTVVVQASGTDRGCTRYT